MDKSLRETLALLTGFIASVPYIFAVMVLWRWFVVPLGVPPVSFWHTAGLALLLRYITADWSNLNQEDEGFTWRKAASDVWRSTMAALVTLMFGLIIHAAML